MSDYADPDPWAAPDRWAGQRYAPQRPPLSDPRALPRVRSAPTGPQGDAGPGWHYSVGGLAAFIPEPQNYREGTCPCCGDPSGSIHPLDDGCAVMLLGAGCLRPREGSGLAPDPKARPARNGPRRATGAARRV